MKMKKLLIGLLVSAMLLSSAACSGTKEESVGGANKETRTVDGNELDAEQYINSYLFGDPSTLDSIKLSDSYGTTVLMNIMEPLTRLDEESGENVRVGAGAESWESNEDGTVWTFKLRDNKWTDGQPVTAQDYVYGIAQTVNPESGSPNSYFLTDIKNAEAIINGDMDISELGIRAVDEKTLEIELEAPASYFLAMTDTRAMLPVRQDLVEKYGEQYGAEADTIVSNGPFMLESWTHNSEIVLVKNEDYWDAGNVYLDKVDWKILNDESTIFNSFDNGSIDHCETGTSEWIDKFSEKEGVLEVTYGDPTVRFHLFNTKDELFQNVYVRKAFMLTFDREDMNETIYFDTKIPAYGWVPKSVTTGDLGEYRAQVDEPIKAMQDDPQELLLKGMEELGLGDDPSQLTVKINFGDTSQWTRNYGEYLQQRLKGVLGVNIELETEEWGSFQNRTNSGDYQIGYMQWGSDYNDPMAILSIIDAIPTSWENQEYNDILKQAAQELDEKARVELYAQAEQILLDEAAVSPVIYMKVIQFKYEYVKNLQETSFNTMGFKKVYTSGR